MDKLETAFLLESAASDPLDPEAEGIDSDVSNEPADRALRDYGKNLAMLVVHTATVIRDRVERGSMRPERLAAAIQALAHALVALAGMRDVDDLETWWLLMDVHACALELKEARVAVERSVRGAMSPPARAAHDRLVREAARANLRRRFLKLTVVVPRLSAKLQCERMTPALELKRVEDLVVGDLTEVVFQHVYAAKGASAYDHFANALGHLGRTLSRGALMNKLSAWRKQGSAPGLMPFGET